MTRILSIVGRTIACLGLGLVALAWQPSPVVAGQCTPAQSAAVLQELAPEDSPFGYRSATDHCFEGRLRGPLKGTLVICLSEGEMEWDDQICSCGSQQPLWTREGEGGALIYRSKAWFTSNQGSFETIERGTQVENEGYASSSYPGPRCYWSGIMQVIPGSGTGSFSNVSHGTILIHNEWNNPSKVKLLGEVCSQ